MFIWFYKHNFENFVHDYIVRKEWRHILGSIICGAISIDIFANQWSFLMICIFIYIG